MRLSIDNLINSHAKMSIGCRVESGSAIIVYDLP